MSGKPAASPRAPARGPLSRFNAVLARLALMLCIGGLFVIIAIVAWQVFGRYVLNASPTWTESLALVLILYVTLIGAAVGVRDAGHIGMESLLVLVPEGVRGKLEMVIHVLVAGFGLCMVYNGWLLGNSVAGYKLANLALNEWVRYVPMVLSGALVALFSLEHIIALARGEDVVPAWH